MTESGRDPNGARRPHADDTSGESNQGPSPVVTKESDEENEQAAAMVEPGGAA